MRESESLGYVSVIGMSLFHPILTLVEILESREAEEPNEVKTSDWENGLASAVVTLATFLLESALNRTSYMRGETVKGGLVNFFREVSSDAELASAVEEVFTARDMIVHNHLWDAQVFWDEDGSLRFKGQPQLREGYGDCKFGRVIDPTTRRSRRLGLNLFPTRVWRRDAYVVLRAVNRALEILGSVDPIYFDFSSRHIKFRDRNMRFLEMLDEITVLGSRDRKALLDALDLVEKSLPGDREMAGYSKRRMVEFINLGRGEVVKPKSNQLSVLKTIEYAISEDSGLQPAYRTLKAALLPFGT